MQLLTQAYNDPDAQLVECVKRGDDDAFRQLMTRYKDRIYTVAYRLVGNHEDALDLAQETFVRAYRNIDGFREEARVYTWLQAIAVNLARNRLRDQSRKGRSLGRSLEALQATRGDSVAVAHGASPSERLAGVELQDVLEACLAALPENFRLAFVLRVFDDLKYDAIAEVSGVPRGTVKSRLNKAREHLRSCLQARGVL